MDAWEWAGCVLLVLAGLVGMWHLLDWASEGAISEPLRTLGELPDMFETE